MVKLQYKASRMVKAPEKASRMRKNDKNNNIPIKSKFPLQKATIFCTIKQCEKHINHYMLCEVCMALDVKLEVFEGPLDLLLHLIEKNKVDIYDIPIVLITEQYLEYIKKMETEDMNVMSEFLLMAATLLDIKCKMLLPKEVDENGEEEDPREELVQKLLEYKMYKYMSFELKDMHMDAERFIYKTSATLPDEVKKYQPPIDYDYLLGEMNLQSLNRIFKETLKRKVDKIDPIRSQFGNIEKDEIELDQKTEYIKQYVISHHQLGFRDLLEKQNSKMEVIVTFLVVLELIKVGIVSIEQDSIFDDILICVCEDAESKLAFLDLENL